MKCISRWVTLGMLFCVFAFCSACNCGDDDDDSSDDDSSDDDTTADDDSDAPYFHEDFEDDVLAQPPGAPWVFEAGSGSILVVDETGHGNVAEMSVAAPGENLSMEWAASDDLSPGVVRIRVDVRLPEENASFGFSVYNLSDILMTSLEFFRDAAGTHVNQSVPMQFPKECALSTPGGDWMTIELRVDTDAWTASVTVNGQEGECHDIDWLDMSAVGTGVGVLSFTNTTAFDAHSMRVDNVFVYSPE